MRLGKGGADRDHHLFLFGTFFALGSGEEHRSLTFAQLEVREGDEEERTRLRYTLFGEKNSCIGGLKHRRINAKVVEQHENITNQKGV